MRFVGIETSWLHKIVLYGVMGAKCLDYCTVQFPQKMWINPRTPFFDKGLFLTMERLQLGQFYPVAPKIVFILFVYLKFHPNRQREKSI